MSLTRRIAALAAAAAVSACPAATAADDAAQVLINRSEIYLTESVLLQLRVPGPPTGEPDLSAIPNCRIRFLGSQDASETRWSNVNGIIRHEGFSGRTYAYEVTPSTAGRHVLGPIRITVGGREVEQDGPTVTVVGTEEQDRVRIEITATQDAVLVDEPFDITLTILMRRMGGSYADYDPINPSDPPALNVPFLEARPIAGLSGPDIQQVLRGLLRTSRDPGFAVNSYTVRADPFDAGNLFDLNAFMRDVPARFALPRQAVEREGAAFFAYSTTLSYRPEREGNYTFGPAVFKGRVVAGVDGSGRPIGPSVLAVGPARTVRVVPPPEAGRPFSYVGTLGSNMTVDATLDTPSCKLGDPLRLRLTVGGAVRLDAIAPPVLSLQSNLLERFTIYDDTAETSKAADRREFSYTIRPKIVGTCEFPPVELSYFDTAARRYRTVATPPIPLQVSGAAELTRDQVLARTNVLGRRPADAATDLPPIAGMRASPDGWQPAPLFGGRLTLAIAATGPVAFLAVALTTLARAGLARRRPRRRRAHALDRALATAAHARRAHAADPAAQRAAVYESLRHFLADRYDSPASGITPADARRLLATGGLLSPAAASFCLAMDQLFDLGFESNPDSAALDLWSRRAVDALRALKADERSARRAGAAPAAAPLLAFGLIAASAGPTLAQTDAEERFMWESANTRLGTARSPSDYIDAARHYQEMIDRGIRNGPVFYNQGVALLLAKRHADAALAFLRAERYIGRAPDISANLRIALARQTGTRLPVEPWQRVLLFWHYGLPCAWRALIGAVGFSLFWLALAARLLGRPRIARYGLSASLALIVLFGSSAVTSLYQESRPNRPLLEAPPPAQPSAARAP